MGAVIVNAGGTLSPGNSPGILNVNSLALTSGTGPLGARTVMQLVENADSTKAGVDFDQVIVANINSTTLGGTLELNFGGILPNGTLPAGTVYNLFIVTAASPGDFNPVTGSGYAPYSGDWTQSGANLWTRNTGPGIGAQLLTFNSLSGDLTVVPEPKTWVLIGIGITFMLYRRRVGRMMRDPRDEE